MINEFIENNRILSTAIGVVVVLGGVALAYFTNDAEPWGTIGGVAAAFGLLFGVYAATKKREA